jgi:hypothetical protein
MQPNSILKFGNNPHRPHEQNNLPTSFFNPQTFAERGFPSEPVEELWVFSLFSYHFSHLLCGKMKGCARV